MDASATDRQNRPALSCLLSSGRSGSTWVGSLLSGCADVAYRFEPFHRRKGVEPFQAFRERMRDGRFDQDDAAETARLLLPANPELCKPPFVRSGILASSSRGALWAASRVIRVSGPYAKIWTPPAGTPVLFKEVTFHREIDGLLAGRVPVVFLVRHPYAVLASILKGQARGVMPDGRLELVPQILRDQGPELLDEFGSRIEQMSPLQRNALLLRLELEVCLRAIRDDDLGLLAFYEAVCADPLGRTEGMAAHVGTTTTPALANFVDRLEHPGPLDRARAKALGRLGSYFTVARKPSAQADRWKVALDADQRRSVDEIFETSEPFRWARGQSPWDD